MNILLIGDPHFKINNTLESERFVKETLQYVDKQKDNIAFIVVLGDVLHTHEKVHLQPLCHAVNFIKALAELKYTFVLIGNHDRINNKVFLTEEHALLGLKNQNNITIVDKVKKFRQFLFVPYVEPGRFQEALDTIECDMGEIKAIFAHQEFYGAKLKNITSEIGDKWPEQNPPIFSGHIHCYQQVQDNIIYIGTPYQIHFGESEDKALALLKIDKNGFAIERIHLNFIKKKTLVLKADDLKNLQLEQGHHYRLIIEDDINYIKNILKLDEIKEKIKHCQLNFKLSENKVERKDHFECAFDKILENKLVNLNQKEKDFYSTISSNSLK